MSSRPRTQDDGRINDIAGVRDAAKLTGCTGAPVVERFDFDEFGTQQAREPRLPTTISPHLRDDARRRREANLLLVSASDDGYDDPFVALKRDECACIQSYAAHAMRRLR